MDVEQQQGTEDQLSLFAGEAAFVRSFAGGKAGSRSAVAGERQASAASEGNRALATDALMEKVCERENLNRAYRKVKSNRGAPGVDGMTVDELGPWLKAHREEVLQGLLEGSHQPQAVRGIEIPKPGGGMRQLGIPTVVDRWVQQAILQVLNPLFDPTFSESSYGFRPGRSTHQALRKAQEYVAEGRTIVVDMDLEKFFDRVNHDLLMSKLAMKIGDARVLTLIRRYLEAGMMADGLVQPRTEGTPQGGPLSPLLSNILLSDLDRELERRGHAFCRYADDCNIYVASERAGVGLLLSLTCFLRERLKLTVNQAKSAVAQPWQRKFLGYSMTWHQDPKLRVAAASLERLTAKVTVLLRGARGRSLGATIQTLNPLLRGWAAYFKLTHTKRTLEERDGWIRRKLRCILWRQWKRRAARVRTLMQRGLSRERASRSARNGRGPWWNAGASHMNAAFPKSWFDRMGLVSLLDTVQRLQRVS